jgi:hypothetical protein
MVAPSEAINRKRGGRRTHFGGFRSRALTRDGRRQTVASSICGIGRKRRSKSQSKRPYPRATPVLALPFLPVVERPRQHDLDDVVVVCIFCHRFHAQYARGEGVVRRGASGLEE